jgi:hypothetical protein
MGDNEEVDDSGGGENENVVIQKNGNGNEKKNDESEPIDVDDDNFSPRVRQYPKSDNGPFLVCIRTKNKNSLQSDKITKSIRQKYKTDVEIKQVNADKLNVLFPVKKLGEATIDDLTTTLAREEANDLPKWNKWNKTYRVYIPEKRVEVIGCISWATTNNVEALMHGAGKFKNLNFPNVEVLEATRFQKNVNPIASTSTAATQGNREKLPVVRVTFSGLVLPEYLVTGEGLLIPVREFKRRQMFCTTCLSYRHTASHCNNKPQESPLGFRCLHCKNNDHETGDKSCPRRKILEKRDQTRAKMVHKKTYAQMLQELDPNAVMPGETTNIHFPVLTGTKRQRMEMRAQSSTHQESPIRKRSKNDSPANQSSAMPPGFTNPAAAAKTHEENNFSLGEFLIPFVQDLNLPPWLKMLIFKFVIPFIDKMFNQCTNSSADQSQMFGSK